MSKLDFQDVFLNFVRRRNDPVTVFLSNGVKLQGKISYYDDHSIALHRDGVTQLVYKHSVATVMPMSKFGVHDVIDVPDDEDNVGNV